MIREDATPVLFQSIDQRRHQERITAKALCEEAGTDPAAYSLYRSKKRVPLESTLIKLNTALEALINAARKNEAHHDGV